MNNNNFDLPKLSNEALNQIQSNNVEQQPQETPAQVTPTPQPEIQAPVAEQPVQESTPKEEVQYENSLKGMFKYLTTQDTKNLLLVLVRIIIIALIILAFYLPVSLISGMGPDLAKLLNIHPVPDVVDKLWYFSLNAIYAVVAIYTFYKTISARYQRLILKKGE